MITNMPSPVSVPAVQSAHQRSVSDPVALPATTTPVDSPRSQVSRPADLASSIMADGGLGFLRSRLEEKLRERFAPDQGATRPADIEGADLSPAATADRIVGFALNLRAAFQRRNEGLEPEELLARFEHEVRRGISEGFAHAEDVLGGLGRLDDGQRQTMASIWDMIQTRLDEAFLPRD